MVLGLYLCIHGCNLGARLPTFGWGVWYETNMDAVVMSVYYTIGHIC